MKKAELFLNNIIPEEIARFITEDPDIINEISVDDRDDADRIFDLENKVARLERRLADARKMPARRWHKLCQDEWDMLKEMCCMVAAEERRPEHLIGLCKDMDAAIQLMIRHLP